MPNRDQVITRSEIPIVKQVAHRLLWVMVLRIFIITALLSTTLFLNYSSQVAFTTPSPRFLLGLIASTYIATILYAIWYKIGRHLTTLAMLQFIVDSLLWGCLVYATGGIASGFTFLFDLWVIVAAVVLGGRATFTMATVSAVVLLTLTSLMFSNILPPLADQIISIVNTKEMIYSLLLNVTGLYLVAGLVNSLVNRIERTRRGLEKERTRRADLTALHSDIITSLTVGLITTGEDGEILTMNPEGTLILGLKDKFAEGMKLCRWLPDIETFIEEKKSIETRGHGIAQLENGKKIPVEYVIAPLLNAKGRRRGSIVIINDLSKVKKLEAALEDARRLSALGELATSLAHEIRNPLSAVYGSFQMLSNRDNLNEEERSLSDIILRELTRMERLINDMLEYTRPRDPARIMLNLSNIVSEVHKIFSLGNEGENINIEFETHGDTTAPIDEGQIRQVLWNLLQNATQSIGESGTVTISVKGGETSVQIEVSDDGPGIKPEHQAKVFDPFFSTREHGLGLGLAICNRIIQSHDSQILIGESKAGGASFKMFLPKHLD